MRIAERSTPRAPSDLTARARIRDAAIDAFAEAGFDVPFRTIATRADVSPGLITHHFGTKSSLREQCDAEVLRRYHALKSEAVDDPTGHLIRRLAEPGDAATLLVYMLRAIHAGGQPARDFMTNLVDHVREVMAQTVASGLVKPSRDEEARLRYLTDQTMGALLVQFLTAHDQTPDAFVASLHERRGDTILPILELYTEGLLTDRKLLDDYLHFLWEPPDGPSDEPS